MCGKSESNQRCDVCTVSDENDSTVAMRGCGHILCDVCSYYDGCGDDDEELDSDRYDEPWEDIFEEEEEEI